MKHPPLLPLVLGLTAVNFALSLFLLLSTQPSATGAKVMLPPGQGILSDSLLGIQESLSKIEDRLATLEARPEMRIARAVSPPVGESPNADELLNLISETSELKEALSALIQNLSAQSTQSLVDVRNENPTPKWGELQNTISLWTQDQVKAQNELVMLSEKEVLLKFGAPTEVWSNNSGINWLYGSGLDPEGGYQTEVWLLFLDGHVTVLGVK
jgi:hypothetical protein